MPHASFQLTARHFCAVLLFAAAVAAQHDTGLPSERVGLVPPGGFVDLDTGIVLPAKHWQKLVADVQFGRDGLGLYLAPLAGGVHAAAGSREPPEELPTERLRIDMHQRGALVAFVRTDHGVARVECYVTDLYTNAAAVLRWIVVPPKDPVFLPAPTALAAEWHNGVLHVQWTGEQARWLVEVETGDVVRKETCTAPGIDLAGLDPKARHRVLVRGLGATNEVSLPASLVQNGPRQPPTVGHVDFGDSWFRRSGGLSVTRGESADEDAEVAFYLYGVFVPGGGVACVGKGQRDFAALHELPAGPFPPVYGRLDNGDVLAIVLADGRCAKLWLDPLDGKDVRSGMRVHYVFLGDGRRTLLAPPADVQVERTAAGPRLSWQAPRGAVRYRITVGDRPPLETAELALVVADLPANRMLQAEVEAIGGDGEVSGAAVATLLTYGADVKHGRAKLDVMGGGFDFAAEAVVSQADVQAGRRADVVIVSFAGGASSLAFGSDVAPGAKFAFGDLPEERELAFAKRIDTDDRQPDSERFYVRTADGGLASVRIVGRAFPLATVEYVWRPKR